MKKKYNKPVTWAEVKVGDFIETNESYLFCFLPGSDNMCPACLGRRKKNKTDFAIYLVDKPYMKTYKPSKSFIKLCHNLLDHNFKKGWVDNLNYIEALNALKNYDTNK